MDSMSPEVRAEYQRALTRATARHGSIVSRDASFYGWTDWDASTHAQRCDVRVPEGAEVSEVSWDEFRGTFYEGDTTVHGVEVDGASCRCGQIKDRRVRWSATVQEVAEAVFTEAFGARQGGV
jgi:hypothetical protein